MKKSIFVIIIVGIIMLGGVFANDCFILTDEENKIPIDEHIKAIVGSYETTYVKILPVEAFERALINLKSQCCKKEIRKTCSESDMQNIKDPYPESAWLFDHLIDVAMRRLDGVKELAYGLDPDPTALDRRKKITAIATNPKVTTPKDIEKLFTGYRGITGITLTMVKDKYTDINTVSLGQKYDSICELMSELYSSTVSEYVVGESFLNGCKNLVKNRVKRETGYIKILMVQKSNQLMDESTKAYTKKYFIEEKLMALWNLIAKVKDIFKTIVQQAPASKTCSK